MYLFDVQNTHLSGEIHYSSNYTCLLKRGSVLPSTYLLLLLSETSFQPQRGLNPCQMLLSYELLYSLEGDCLFSFGDSWLLPNIISFQHRCKGSNDLNYFTVLTLWRDGYQFNYGQLKMIWESPALDIYHHYELLTRPRPEHFHSVPFVLGRHYDLYRAHLVCHL